MVLSCYWGNGDIKEPGLVNNDISYQLVTYNHLFQGTTNSKPGTQWYIFLELYRDRRLGNNNFLRFHK